VFDETIEVVGAEPVHGLGIDRNKIPGNVQQVSDEAMPRTGGFGVAEQLHRAARVANVFDSSYSTFGVLGDADDVLGDGL
jgi:hypothetical protein